MPEPTTVTPPSLNTINADGTINEAPVAPIVTKEAPVAPVKETPVEAVKEEQDDKTSFDDFKDVLNQPLQHPAPKKTVEVPKVEKKEDVVLPKKEDVVPPVKKEEAPTVTKSDGTKALARDYTGVSDEVKPLLERMSNEAFNHFKPLVLELPKLQQKLTESEKRITELSSGRPPENYNEHPDGYILSPEFSQAAKEVQEANIVATHWQQQFDAVEGGALKYKTLGRDAQGNLCTTGEVDAGADAKSKLLRNMTWSQQQVDTKQARITLIQESHKVKYQEAAAWLENAQKQWFTKVNEENHPLQPLIKSTLESFPATFRANPVAKALAKSLVLNVRFAEVISQLQKNGGKMESAPDAKEQERLAKIKKQELEAGPTGTTAVAATAPNKADEDVTMDDFDKVIKG
jgi:hypothetical protein